MKSTILFLIGVIVSSVYSQDMFTGLTRLEVDEGITVYFNASKCRLLNTVVPNEADIKEIDVLITRLIPSKPDSFLVRYSEGPSVDPSFVVYRIENDSSKLLSYAIDALSLYIPGNGFLYFSGHTDSMFDTRRKYVVRKDTLTEIKQAYYYVGLDSQAMDDLILYSGINEPTVVAQASKGSSLHIVANQGDYYLVKTPFGLLGWVKLIRGYGETTFKGIFFAGD